jgi:adenine-specific DNA-methyltransferase
MAKTTYTTQKRPAGQYAHPGRQRVNHPPVRLVDAESEAAEGRNTGRIESGGRDEIALWVPDTDYDGRSLFARQVFFPMAGEKEGWSTLAKNLWAEIDEEAIQDYYGTVSLPFKLGKHSRVGVNTLDGREGESSSIMELQ